MAQFSAEAEDVVAVDTECARCGRGSTAMVKSRGKGVATSFVGFDRGTAREAAMEMARAEVVHQAKVTLSLVPCVHCGYRSRRDLAWFVGLAAVGTLIFTALTVGLWLLGSRWWLVALMAFGAVTVPLRARARLKKVSSLVLSVRPRAVLPPAQVVSAPAPVVPVTRAPSPAPAPSDTPRLLR